MRISRSATLRAGLRQRGKGVFFVYPALIPHPGSPGLGNVTGLFSGRPWRDWSIADKGTGVSRMRDYSVSPLKSRVPAERSFCRIFVCRGCGFVPPLQAYMFYCPPTLPPSLPKTRKPARSGGPVPGTRIQGRLTHFAAAALVPGRRSAALRAGLRQRGKGRFF
jgi:hypothetical protein